MTATDVTMPTPQLQPTATVLANNAHMQVDANHAQVQPNENGTPPAPMATPPQPTANPAVQMQLGTANGNTQAKQLAAVNVNAQHAANGALPSSQPPAQNKPTVENNAAEQQRTPPRTPRLATPKTQQSDTSETPQATIANTNAEFFLDLSPKIKTPDKKPCESQHLTSTA
jgi:hypothetical protein